MTLIVDAHQHVGELGDSLSWDGSDHPSTGIDVDGEVARRLAIMDAVGVDWAVVQPSHGYLRPDGIADTMRVNDAMAAIRAKAPQRFRAMGTTEPLHGARSLDELDRAKSIGLHGIAWHHRFQGCYIDSKWMWPTLRRMQELGLVPLVHVNPESSLEAHWRLQRLALEFPDLTFLAMDGFWNYERARHILFTASFTPNVVWDLGGPVCYLNVQEWVERNGSETLCFSLGGGYSSAGAVQKPALLAQIENAAIADTDKANILGRNVERVLGT